MLKVLYFGSGIALMAALFLFRAQKIEAGEPLDAVRIAADNAIQVLKDPQLRAPDKKQERSARLREIVNPIFDYDEMAMRTLGPHWRRRTPQERHEFVEIFRKFLEKIYSDKADLYDGEKIVFGRESIDKEFAQVDSRIIDTKGEEFAVVYRLRRSGGKWKIYDAVAENVSIVNNYRSQFDRVINKHSFNELKRLLKEKAG